MPVIRACTPTSGQVPALECLLHKLPGHPVSLPTTNGSAVANTSMSNVPVPWLARPTYANSVNATTSPRANHFRVDKSPQFRAPSLSTLSMPACPLQSVLDTYQGVTFYVKPEKNDHNSELKPSKFQVSQHFCCSEAASSSVNKPKVQIRFDPSKIFPKNTVIISESNGAAPIMKFHVYHLIETEPVRIRTRTCGQISPLFFHLPTLLTAKDIGMLRRIIPLDCARRYKIKENESPTASFFRRSIPGVLMSYLDIPFFIFIYDQAELSLNLRNLRKVAFDAGKLRTNTACRGVDIVEGKKLSNTTDVSIGKPLTERASCARFKTITVPRLP